MDLKNSTQSNVEIIRNEQDCGQSPVTYRQKFLQTLWSFTAIFGLGAAVNVRGPAMLDLQRTTGTSIDEITAAVFVTIALGWAVGSIVGGFLYDRFDKQLVISLCILMSAVSTFVIPWCSHVILLAVIIIISGASLAASFTGVATMTLTLWGPQAPPYMQMQDFSYSAGGVVGILVLEAFTGSKSEVGHKRSLKCAVNSQINTTRHSNQIVSTNYTQPFINASSYNLQISNSSTKTESDHGLGFEYVYVILGIYLLLAAFPYLVYYFKKIDLLNQKSDTVDKETERSREHVQPKIHLKYALLICVFALYFFFVGGNESFYGLMTTFTVNFLCWSRSHGNLIPSMTWGTTAAAQVVCIVVAKYVKPIVIMVFSMTLGTLTLLLLMFTVEYSSTMMWVCAAIYGVASAPIFPNGLSWINNHIVVSGKLMALVQIFGGLGAVSIPALVGWLFENASGIWFIYVAFMCAASCSVALYCGLFIGNKYGDRFSSDIIATTVNGTTGENCQGEDIPLSENPEEAVNHSV